MNKQVEEYKNNPCAYSAIPYWKLKLIALSENIKVMHENEWKTLENRKELSYTKVDKFFRLKHDLIDLKEIALPEGYSFRIFNSLRYEDYEDAVKIINKSYDNISISKERLEGYTRNKVYNDRLWIFIDNKNHEPVSLGISDTDYEIGEGILEWIQVLPDYRNKGLATALVNKLLITMSKEVSFATVSGDINNESNPISLYKRSGFTGEDIWYIVYLNNN